MNISLVLEMAADAMGGRRAIGSLTYDDVRREATAVAAHVAADNGRPRSLASLLPNGTHLPAAIFGAAWAGVSYAPLNFRLPESAQLAQLGRLEPTFRLTEECLRGGIDRCDPVEMPENPAVLLFTSGTSSEPKTAALKHENLTSYLFNTLEFGSAAEDEAVLLAVPPFHIAGVAAVLSSTFVGRRIVPMARFDAGEWLRVARAESITHAFLVPTMVGRIVDELTKDPQLLPTSLRSLSYGGARMPRPVLERALELLPDVDFVNAYGLTETASTVALLGPADHRRAISSSDERVRKVLDSIGRPVPGIEFTVVADELLVRGPQVAGEYIGEESKVDADGWLHTGDRGHIDDEGYVYIEGRADDMIIRGGENLSPLEIEDAILRHPAVSAAAVVGLPDSEWGQRVVAMVVPLDGAALEAEALQSWVKELLGSIKTPSSITVAGELPTGPTGKILRRDIRSLLGATGA